jgi:ubiquinone/menaquinone biosynthesis C-methylase UbiE
MKTTFANQFCLPDLLVFDEVHFCRVVGGCRQKMTLPRLAWGLHAAPAPLVERVSACLSPEAREPFWREVQRPVPVCEVARARRVLLDLCFWELTYWSTPELYEELTIGERLHPGIFQHLEPLLRGKVVLDAGAGSGRASFESIHHGARLVYALDPSPGLLRLLQQKVACSPAAAQIVPGLGDFAHLPLAAESVDLALACSSFTAEPQQGGAAGLAELRRVVRPGGAIAFIWPRLEDRAWLSARGFHYVTLPGARDLCVHFSSFASALRSARRFYAGNPAVVHYLLNARQPVVPFSVLGMHPPGDYCWARVR